MAYSRRHSQAYKMTLNKQKTQFLMSLKTHRIY